MECEGVAKWKMWNILLLHCTGLTEERMGMERLMNETVERWQEMEVKDKVVSLDGR